MIMKHQHCSLKVYILFFFNPPLTHYVNRYTLFSSFDGLVLLAADTPAFVVEPLNKRNRTTSPTEFDFMSTSFGLGYDDAVDGYKILKLDMCRQYPMEILTLKTDFWRKIVTIQLPLWYMYVHGAFHWIGDLMVPGNLYTVSFSISNEVYGDVPLLDDMGKIKSYDPDFGLSLLDGMLCYYTTNGSLDSFKLWAMKDYGVEESWIVLCTLQFNGLAIAQPRYRFPDRELLLYAPGELPHQCGVLSSYTFQTSEGKFGFWPERGVSFDREGNRL
ncbi:hypothetical protein P3S67_018808 [Capsicum chacoense]